jgi:hypothetical protein
MYKKTGYGRRELPEAMVLSDGLPHDSNPSKSADGLKVKLTTLENGCANRSSMCSVLKRALSEVLSDIGFEHCACAESNGFRGVDKDLRLDCTAIIYCRCK